MRILLINYEYPPVGGGASNATWEIARALARLGHAPVVLTARYRHRTADTAESGVKVIEVPAWRRRADRCSVVEMASFTCSATWSIRRILRAEKIDGMVAFFSIPGGPVAWWGWRGTKIPYLVSLRGGDVPGNEPGLAWMHRLLRPLRCAVFRGARSVTAVSSDLKKKSEAADPFPVSVISNGIDTDFWHPPVQPLTPSPYRLLFVGRFQPQKNLPWLFAQLAELTKDSAVPPWILEMVGDGPQRAELVALSARLGLSPHLSWPGWLSKSALREAYHRSHLLLLPSLYEGMSNAALEASACEVPVLTLSTHFPASGRDVQPVTLPAILKAVISGQTVDQFVTRITAPSWSTTAESLVASLA